MDGRKARNRYWHRHWWLPAKAEPALRALRPLTKILPIRSTSDYGSLLGVRTLRTPFRDGLPLLRRVGLVLAAARAILYLREFLREHPEVERHYRDPDPEESLVQTVLVNSGRFELVDDDFRYIDYTRAQKGSPRTLTVRRHAAAGLGALPLRPQVRPRGGRRRCWTAIDREMLEGPWPRPQPPLLPALHPPRPGRRGSGWPKTLEAPLSPEGRVAGREEEVRE